MAEIDIRRYLKEKKDLVDQALKGLFTGNNLLFRMMFYSLNGGKRLRPILAITSYESCGGDDINKIMPVACGIELIHTYSLIHDDLPAMDDDDYRRGKESAHKKFGEADAILSGDGLFAYAFELFCKGEDCVERRFGVIREIAKTVGPNGIVYGQYLDIEKYNHPSPKKLRVIHLNKTAKFIASSIKCGAIMANAEKRLKENLYKAGLFMGMLFQYTDDILDVTGKSEELGKTPGKDKREGKLTAPAIYGLNGARFRARCYAALAGRRFGALGKRFEIFKALTEYILNRSF